MNHSDGCFHPEDLQWLETIATKTAFAVGHAQLLEQVSKQDRMAAIGQMMAELLHDVRNPIASIGFLREKMIRTVEQSERARYGEHITQQLQDMTAMISDVLAFVKGG